MSRIIALVMLCSGVAAAQPARQGAERAQERRELRQDHYETRDDMIDAARLRAAIVGFDRARAMRDYRTLAAIDREVSTLIAVEQRESAGELRRDDLEARRTLRDRDGSWRDDRRDRRDDIRDRNLEARTMARRSAIAAEWNALVGWQDVVSLGRKRAILTELNKMARAELRQDDRETKEDRRELREDRRGRRGR
jgi:hypothetical protein